MTFKKPISRIINALNSSSTHIPIPPEYASLELSPCPPTKLEEAFSQQFSGRKATQHGHLPPSKWVQPLSA